METTVKNQADKSIAISFKKIYSVSNLIIENNKKEIANNPIYNTFTFIKSKKEILDTDRIVPMYCDECFQDINSNNPYFCVNYVKTNYKSEKLNSIIDNNLNICPDCRSLLRVFFDKVFTPGHIQEDIEKYFPIVFKEVKIFYPSYFSYLTERSYEFIESIIKSIQKRKLNTKWNIVEKENKEIMKLFSKFECPNVEPDLEPDNEIAVYHSFDHTIKPISPEIVTANREHTCSCCDRAINKGEMYHTHRLLIDKKFVTYKTCIDCLSIVNTFFDGVFGYSYNYMIEKLIEHIESMSENERFLSENIQNSLSFKSNRLLHDLMDKVDLQEDMKKAIDKAKEPDTINEIIEGETE